MDGDTRLISYASFLHFGLSGAPFPKLFYKPDTRPKSSARKALKYIDQDQVHVCFKSNFQVKSCLKYNSTHMIKTGETCFVIVGCFSSVLTEVQKGQVKDSTIEGCVFLLYLAKSDEEFEFDLSQDDSSL